MHHTVPWAPLYISLFMASITGIAVAVERTYGTDTEHPKATRPNDWPWLGLENFDQYSNSQFPCSTEASANAVTIPHKTTITSQLCQPSSLGQGVTDVLISKHFLKPAPCPMGLIFTFKPNFPSAFLTPFSYINRVLGPDCILWAQGIPVPKTCSKSVP